MQISRHWRLNSQRYRLEGWRRPDGTLSLSGGFHRSIEGGPIGRSEAKVETGKKAAGIVAQALAKVVSDGEQHAA